MPFNPTDEQRLAINEKGNVLVSAAAGSGKTAVLVERVVRQLTDEQNPIDADKLLIVTFTNAAAAEMRTRIELRLEAECRANPDNIGLLKQRQLLSSAKICTIDSFCIDLVRENFESLGVSPDFKISDQNSLTPVNEHVLSGILNEYYEKKDPVFYRLLDLIGTEYDDGNFSAYILDMYNYSRQLANPTEWFDSLSELYSPEGFNPQNKWYSYALNRAEQKAQDMQRVCALVLDNLVTDQDLYDKYGHCFETIAEQLNSLLIAVKNQSFEEVYKVLSEFSAPKIPSTRKFAEKLAKTGRDYCIASIDKLQKLFYTGEEDIKEQLKSIYEPTKRLSEILKELDSRLFAEYLNRNTLTFHNTEHLALKLLSSEQSTELQDRYVEVCVDEYQDTNDLQDSLFYVLSGNGKRLFAVGDVKQSIYGFRGAKPENFLNKINSANTVDKAKENEPKKIILGKNFRSRPEICEFINFFFKSVMTAKTGNLVYNEEEKLISAAVYPETTDIPVSIDIINPMLSETDALKTEAGQIAEYIKKVMAGGECIRETEDTLRKAKYSDFAILLRYTKNKAEIIAKELEKRGIPVNYSAEEYAETTEISVFLSLLKVIDNPESDIELLAVLMSPIFGFTADETANLRIKRRKGSLYSALVFAAENGDSHAKSALEDLEKYRILSVTLALPRLISRLLSITDYLNTVSALKDGGRRRGNLLLLIDYAEKYNAENGGGLGGFVNYILKQSENGIKSAATLSEGDTVKIMTIHSSKGLQFPVCIVATAANSFSNKESRSTALYTADLGIGYRYFDEEKQQKLTTIGREVILDMDKQSSLEEELRLLYVAMTRAEDKLHFTAVVPKKFDDNLKGDGYSLALAEYKPENLLEDQNSYFRWLLFVLMLHPDGGVLREEGIGINSLKTNSRVVINKIIPTVETEEIAVAEKEEVTIDANLANAIKEAVSFKYPFEELLEIEAKASVSVLANKAESDKYAFSARPAFMSDGGITPAERGTATHKIIEFIDFDKTNDLEAEIDRLYEWQFITEREANAVNREQLKSFFESDIFARIKAADNVEREMRFITEMPVSRLNSQLSDSLVNENIIIQGAVDLCFEEAGEIVVLDFKTDRTDNPESLREAYGEQLSIYAKACEKIFEKRVKQKIIYSFSLSKEIEI